MKKEKNYNDVMLTCKEMQDGVPPLENPASIKLAADRILTSRKHDKQIAQMVLAYGETGQWPPLEDEQKLIFSMRLTFAWEFCLKQVDAGNPRQFSQDGVFATIAALVTDRWHRTAGLWLLHALNIDEQLWLTFNRPAYHKPSKMLQEVMKTQATK